MFRLCDLVLLGMHGKLVDFEITGVSFTFSAGVPAEGSEIWMMGVKMTTCNWGVLFTLKTGVSLEFDKESIGVNEILCTDCEEWID